MISRSAISAEIKALENELGVCLFERNPNSRRIELTPVGRLVLRVAAQVLQSLDNLRKDIQDLTGTSRNECAIRVACASSMGMYLFGRVLREFRAHFPQIEVALWVETDTQGVAAGFREGLYDMVVLPIDITLPGTHRHLILRQRLAMVGSATLAEVGLQESFPWDAIPVALPAKGTYVRRAIDRCFLEHGISPRVSLEARHPEAIKAALKMLNLVGVAHRISVAEEISNRTFIELTPMSLPVVVYQVALCRSPHASGEVLGALDFLAHLVLAAETEATAT
jgi:DNA-binding transcriptional LysR family regulator